MVQKLFKIFLEPRTVDEDAKRREYILNILLASTIAMLAIFAGIALYYYLLRGGGRDESINPFLFAILPAFLSLLLSLSRKGYFIVSSYLFIAAFFLSNTYAAYHWGVQLQPALLGYALVIIIASILINTRFGFIITGAIAATIIALWYLQYNHLITIARSVHDADEAVIFSILYFLIMSVAWLSNREIERSLLRARKSEQALAEERDLLEIKVEERTSELRESQLEKMQEVYRFAEFGRLASGLFHDILNVVNVLSLRVQEESPDAASLQGAINTTKQIENFMQGMRKQLHSQAVSETFSLNESIHQAIQLVLYKAHKENGRVVFDAPIEMPYFGNPFEFHQMMINLINNAIESYATLMQERDRKIIISLNKENERTIITIKDNGRGIPENMAMKIFDPFFTTKPGANGIGIGLATVKKIIENNFHGAIAVQSIEGEGSQFTIVFDN